MPQYRRSQIAFAKQEGEIQGTIALIIRLLKKRFGEVPENIKNQLSDFSLEELENLSDLTLLLSMIYQITWQRSNVDN